MGMCNLVHLVFKMTCKFFENVLSFQLICVSFPGVHDSYWTHAGDVEQMNVILRMNFVKLYEQPILENVSFCNTSTLLYCIRKSNHLQVVLLSFRSLFNVN